LAENLSYVVWSGIALILHHVVIKLDNRHFTYMLAFSYSFSRCSIRSIISSV